MSEPVGIQHLAPDTTRHQTLEQLAVSLRRGEPACLM